MLNGYIINQKASLQYVVVLSTTEVEYIAATKSIKEAFWLKGMIEELTIAQETVKVHYNNSNTIYLSRNPAHHDRTKHTDIKWHFIKNALSKDVIKMLKVHTDNNPTNMLKKVIPTTKFKVCSNIASVCSL